MKIIYYFQLNFKKMEELTPNEKLDSLLEYFIKSYDVPYKPHVTIISERGILDTKEYFEIVHRLLKDGFIDEQQAIINGSNRTIYGSTFDGRLFYNFGGYVAKSLHDASSSEQQSREIARLRTVDENSEKNQRRLNTLTFWLIVVTLLLFSWQVFLYFYPVHANFRYFFWQ